MDMDAEDMDAIAAAVTGAGGAAALPGDEYGSLHRQQQQQMLEHYQQLARQREAAAFAAPPRPAPRAAAAAAGEDDIPDLIDDEAAAAEAAADAADAAAAAAAVTGIAVGGDEPLDLPEGINLEEARMLEAAMLGIPYQGRMPDFSNAAAAAAAGPPLSPGAMEQRSLRAEQDAAYEESLALDRCEAWQWQSELRNAYTFCLCAECNAAPRSRPKLLMTQPGSVGGGGGGTQETLPDIGTCLCFLYVVCQNLLTNLLTST
jgi:hypothetical protein